MKTKTILITKHELVQIISSCYVKGLIEGQYNSNKKTLNKKNYKEIKKDVMNIFWYKRN